MSKISKTIDSIVKLLPRHPALCVFVPCLAFEGPAVAYFNRIGAFGELIIVFGLFCIQPMLYIVLRKIK